MAQTPAQKRAAATAVMTALAKTNSDLANRIVDDFINSGLTYSSQVHADVTQVYAVNAAWGATLNAFFSDPVAVQQEGQNLFTQLSQPIGNTLNKAGPAIAGVGQGVAAATGSGLTAAASPLGALFNAHIWIRVGEVALGLILIAVGVAKLTSSVPIATKIARYVK